MVARRERMHSAIFVLVLISTASALTASFYQDDIDERDLEKEALLERLSEMIAAARSERGQSVALEDLYDEEGQVPPVGGGRRRLTPQEQQAQDQEYEDLYESLGFMPPQSNPNQQRQRGLDLQEQLDALPKQFAYHPDDPRFYLSQSAFPSSTGKSSSFSTFNDAKSDRPQELPEHVSEGHVSQREFPAQAPPMKKQEAGVIQELPDEYQSHAQVSPHHAESPGSTYRVIQAPSPFRDFYFIAIVAGCTAVILVGLAAAGVCAYRLRERIKSTESVDYGVTGPSKDVSPSVGDRHLAKSAHLYHYQHQKQQMAALQMNPKERAGSDVESEDENDDDLDYTVYECPGLAPAGEMEVKNPLFNDDATPSTPYDSANVENETKPAEEGPPPKEKPKEESTKLEKPPKKNKKGKK